MIKDPFAICDESSTTKWTQEQAIQLCREVEAVCVPFGCHVALTGGTLYRNGPRKDCDLIFYRIRQVEVVDFEGLWGALDSIGLVMTSGFGWCFKARYNGKSVDCLFPEEQEGEYPGGPPDPQDRTLNFDLDLGS